MLYQWDATREPIERVFGLFWQVRTSTEETMLRSQALARGAQSEVVAIDAAIAAALSKRWKLERVASVDKCILRIAIYELMREPGTPGPVIIDEAVELAKRFGEADSPAFVNGILDTILHSVRGEPEKR
jgi:N utilization substance protein B